MRWRFLAFCARGKPPREIDRSGIGEQHLCQDKSIRFISQDPSVRMGYAVCSLCICIYSHPTETHFSLEFFCSYTLSLSFYISFSEWGQHKHKKVETQMKAMFFFLLQLTCYTKDLRDTDAQWHFKQNQQRFALDDVDRHEGTGTARESRVNMIFSFEITCKNLIHSRNFRTMVMVVVGISFSSKKNSHLPKKRINRK